VPPGAEERARAEAERRAAEILERQVPELPEGVSADGAATPEGVANVLALPEVRESKEVGNALSFYATGDRALLRAVTESSPYVEEARDTVGKVRAIEPPEGTSFLVGGLPAGQKDFISNLYGNVPYAVAFVLGVTYLVLFLTFRSVFIPLKAVIVNILSLTASFGAMVFVFQDGNLSGVLGFTPLGFVDATLPILMFCTIFGVSMDYEVFLLSRIREAYEEGESNTASVAKGLVATAGIITSAAAIIVVVTGAFAFTGIITTKAVGLGLAVAVLVDATIIRVLLVPATMRILGDWNWWPGGRKKSVIRAKSEESRRTMKIIATAAVVAVGVFALTGFVAASILGLGLAVIVLVNAALICALLLPVVMRAFGERDRRSAGESVFEVRGTTGTSRGDRRSPGGGGSPIGEQYHRDAQNFVGPVERQEAAGNGHPGRDRAQQKGRHVEDPERQSARPRPGRAHLDGFRRLGRELRNAAKLVNDEQARPEPDEGNHYPGRPTQEKQGRRS
jgi:uncharacterized membrane protein YdfJ with MMPL/SSD domain